MAIYEIFGSRDRSVDQSGTGSSAELQYVIDNTTDDQSAALQVSLTSPLAYYGLKRDNISVKQAGPKYWIATVRYKDKDKEEDEDKGGDHVEIGEGVFSFDTTGETMHITNVKAGAESKNDKAASSGNDTPDLAGGIGVHGDKVEGVDIVSPGLRLTYRTRLPKSMVTMQWIKDVASITGTTNDFEFYTFAKGELLFLGVTGEQSGSTDPELSFNFLAASNIVDRVYELNGGGTTTVSKTGHQYMWFYYKHEEDETTKTLNLKPHAVFVDTVYEESNFFNLGIGTGNAGPPPPEDPPPEE
jgi:hypothetical protein